VEADLAHGERRLTPAELLRPWAARALGLLAGEQPPAPL